MHVSKMTLMYTICQYLFNLWSWIVGPFHCRNQYRNHKYPPGQHDPTPRPKTPHYGHDPQAQRDTMLITTVQHVTKPLTTQHIRDNY